MRFGLGFGLRMRIFLYMMVVRSLTCKRLSSFRFRRFFRGLVFFLLGPLVCINFCLSKITFLPSSHAHL